MTDITGRPRRYTLMPREYTSNTEVGWYLSALAEASERVLDQVRFLSRNELNQTPANNTISVGRLLLHLAWAEQRWITRVDWAVNAGGENDSNANEVTLDVNRIEAIEMGDLSRFADSPPVVDSVAQIERIYSNLRDRFTFPICAPVTDIEIPVEHTCVKSIRHVLQHLLWHWTYHSGQIGLLTHQLGYNYVWTFADD